MKKILATTDFSKRSEASLQRGKMLAAQTGAELVFLHVLDDHTLDRLPHISDGSAADALEQLAQATGARWRIGTGDVPKAIENAADAEGADLIVLGPPGRRNLREAITGTTAERIIRNSDVAVLMAVSETEQEYEHILLATDFSSASLKAAEGLKSTNLLMTARLSVVSVFSAPAIQAMTQASTTTEQITHYIQSEGEKARQDLKNYTAQAGIEDAQLLVKLSRASIGRTVCAAGDEVGADLIVVGTHAKTGIARMVLGSVAEEVLRLSNVDVLAVPPR